MNENKKKQCWVKERNKRTKIKEKLRNESMGRKGRKM